MTRNVHTYYFPFVEYRFGKPLKDPEEEPIRKQKSKWRDTMEVKCGYGKKWVAVGCESCEESCGGCDVEGCVDPRGCTEPPKSNLKIYGEYDGGGSPVPSDRRREYNLFQEKKIEEFEVGTKFWYMCSDGMVYIEIVIACITTKIINIYLFNEYTNFIDGM